MKKPVIQILITVDPTSVRWVDDEPPSLQDFVVAELTSNMDWVKWGYTISARTGYDDDSLTDSSATDELKRDVVELASVHYQSCYR